MTATPKKRKMDTALAFVRRQPLLIQKDQFGSIGRIADRRIRIRLIDNQSADRVTELRVAVHIGNVESQRVYFRNIISSRAYHPEPERRNI